MKRSNAPIFWSLFGAGGMLSALTGPALVFITGIAVPMAFLVSPDLMSYAHVHAFAQHWFGKACLFAFVSLFMWHGVHRIFHSLHDIGIHTGAVAKLCSYGGALAGTLLAGYALLSIGF